MVQVNNAPINLRVKFIKLGNMQYISHLDLVRTMTRVVIRSKLPLYYTEGFNPIPKLVFAAPLSIGTVSLLEFMDIRLTERVSPEDAMRALNENLTEDMQISEAYYPDSKFADLKWFSYVITIQTDGADKALMEKCVNELLSDEVIVEKKSKSKTEPLKSVNIRPLIYSVDGYIREGKNNGYIKDGCLICLNCTLCADPSSFLNPEHIISYLKEKIGILSNPNLTSEWYSILRTRAFKADMTEFK